MGIVNIELPDAIEGKRYYKEEWYRLEKKNGKPEDSKVCRLRVFWFVVLYGCGVVCVGCLQIWYVQFGSLVTWLCLVCACGWVWCVRVVWCGVCVNVI